ncbi:MAG: ABC transporter permease subunit [Bacteroidetes bacterium]|nr:ABC transporter permease subunit [Bacteroidota bacterium]
MFNLIGIELFKIITKPRSYLGFLAITLIILLIQFAFYIDGKQYLDFVFQSLQNSFQIEGNVMNGSLICFIILQMLIVQMPLLIALVTGDLVSGEAASGTIRMLLSKPYSRSQILWAKYIAGSIYTFALIAWLGILALGLGLLIFGNGDLVVLKSDELVILRADDVLWRFLTAFFVAFLSLSMVTTFSLMLSCFTDNSITPIVASMSVIIIFTIIGTLDVPLFDKIKPALFTTHMIIWRNLFDNPLPMEQIIQSLSVIVLHIAVFLSIAFWHFNRKDIQN